MEPEVRARPDWVASARRLLRDPLVVATGVLLLAGLLVVNPLMATADVVADRRLGPLSVDSPFNGLRGIGNKTGQERLWPAAFATLGVISLLSLIVASRRLRTPANSER